MQLCNQQGRCYIYTANSTDADGIVNFSLHDVKASDVEYYLIYACIIVGVILLLTSLTALGMLLFFVISQEKASVEIISMLRKYNDRLQFSKNDSLLLNKCHTATEYLKYTIDSIKLLYEFFQALFSQLFDTRKDLGSYIHIVGDSTVVELTTTEAEVSFDLGSNIIPETNRDEILPEMIRQRSIPDHIYRVIAVQLISGKSLTTGKGGLIGLTLVDNADPYVIVNALTDSNHCSCSCTSRTNDRADVVEWNQTIHISTSRTGKVVLTVLGRNNVVFHEFLGQAFIDLNDIQNIFSGETVNLDLKIQKKTFPIYDGTGSVMEVVNHENPTGILQVQVTALSITSTLCGWLLLQSVSVFGVPFYERMWMVLVNGFLYCYDNPYGGDSVLKKMWNCSIILDVSKIDGPNIFSCDDGTACGFKIVFGGSTVEGQNNFTLLCGCISTVAGHAEIERQFWVDALSPYSEKGQRFEREHVASCGLGDDGIDMTSSSPYTVR